MTAQKGKDLLVKISDGAGGFTTVAGLRTRRLGFNAETVDVTNAESSNRWRELLDGAGDLVALTERFGTGRLKARDLTRIIAAGLRGAGEAVSDDEVAAMQVDGGAQGYLRIRW